MSNGLITLMAGFTTVRDLGAQGPAIFSVRDAINQGRIPGPRIFASGRAISVTAGQFDEYSFKVGGNRYVAVIEE